MDNSTENKNIDNSILTTLLQLDIHNITYAVNNYNGGNLHVNLQTTYKTQYYCVNCRTKELYYRLRSFSFSIAGITSHVPNSTYYGGIITTFKNTTLQEVKEKIVEIAPEHQEQYDITQDLIFKPELPKTIELLRVKEPLKQVKKKTAKQIEKDNEYKIHTISNQANKIAKSQSIYKPPKKKRIFLPVYFIQENSDSQLIKPIKTVSELQGLCALLHVLQKLDSKTFTDTPPKIKVTDFKTLLPVRLQNRYLQVLKSYQEKNYISNYAIANKIITFEPTQDLFNLLPEKAKEEEPKNKQPQYIRLTYDIILNAFKTENLSNNGFNCFLYMFRTYAQLNPSKPFYRNRLCHNLIKDFNLGTDHGRQTTLNRLNKYLSYFASIGMVKPVTVTSDDYVLNSNVQLTFKKISNTTN